VQNSADVLKVYTNPVQVFELHRFGADAMLGQCLLPLHNLPKGGRPRYQWVELLDHSAAGRDLGEASKPELQSRTDAAGRNLVHLRLAWSDHHQQSSYCAVHTVFRGIGFSVIDSLSRRIARELVFVHLMDVQVCSYSLAAWSAVLTQSSAVELVECLKQILNLESAKTICCYHIHICNVSYIVRTN
jgi:hypothetical protein